MKIRHGHITRPMLIDALATGMSKDRAARAAGYAKRQELNRRLRNEGLCRSRLACGVPLITAKEPNRG